MTQLSIAIVLLGMMGLVAFLAWLRMGTSLAVRVEGLEGRVTEIEASPRMQKAEEAQLKLFNEFSAVRADVERLKLKAGWEGK